MSEPAARPNILFVTSDQHRADHLGCAGHPSSEGVMPMFSSTVMWGNRPIS